MQAKMVYLMRGLPSCGKSYTANQLAGDYGIVLETDSYFYSEVGSDPNRYDYSEALLPEARKWNFNRFVQATANGISPIIIDRGNGLNPETAQYARHAVEYGYSVELKEPASEWWQEIRVLLKYKSLVQEVLDQWAEKLAEKSRNGHRVPASTIQRWMKHWKHDLTVEQILTLCPESLTPGPNG